MISERTLKRWRKEALNDEPKMIGLAVKANDNVTTSISVIHTLNDRILRMTQELLDQCLMRRK